MGIKIEKPRIPFYPNDTKGVEHNYASHILHIQDFMDTRTNLLVYEMESGKSPSDNPFFYNKPDTVTWHAGLTTGLLFLLSNIQTGVQPSLTSQLIITLKQRYGVQNERDLINYLQLLILGLLRALKNAKDATKTKGLLVRSLISHQSSKPLPWMKTAASEKYEEYWETQNNSLWYMMQSSKGVYNFTVNGLGMAKALQLAKRLDLLKESRQLIDEIIFDAVQYLVDNQWKAKGFTLQTDEYVQFLKMTWNGHNALMQTAMLKSASLVNARFIQPYNQNAKVNLDLFVQYAEAYGKLGVFPGRNTFTNISYSVDMQMTFTLLAYLTMKHTLMLKSAINRDFLKSAKKGLKYLWLFMKDYVNYPFAALAYLCEDPTNKEQLSWLDRDFYDFPKYPKMDYPKNVFEEDVNRSYPLSWRRPSPFYPKDSSHSYYRNDLQSLINQLSAVDFILLYPLKAYWMKLTNA